MRLLCYIMLFCCACSSPRPTREIFAALETQNAQQQSKLPNENTCNKIESLLDELLQHTQLQCTQEEKQIFTSALHTYQFYSFLHPKQEKYKKLYSYYDYAQKTDIELPSGLLTETLKMVRIKSEQAAEKFHQLQKFWQNHPEEHEQFIQKLQVAWEVGGIIRESELNHFEAIFIEDTMRDQYAQYIQEFEKNDFRNIAILEKKFLERLSLHKLEDEKAKKHFDVVIKSAKRHFALLQYFQTKQNWTEAEKEQIIQSKNKLYYYGLKRKLTKQTYQGNTASYIQKQDTVFFFHTHPHHPDLIYNKRPSAQDKLLTFRMGPSIVFDIHDNRINMYLTSLGKEFPKVQWVLTKK